MQPTRRLPGGVIVVDEAVDPLRWLAELRGPTHTPYRRPLLSAEVIAEIDALWATHHNRGAVIAATDKRWHYIAHLRIDLLELGDCTNCRLQGASGRCPPTCPLFQINRTP